MQALSLRLEMHKIGVIIFAQISHSCVATYIHQHDAWYEYNHNYIEEAVESDKLSEPE